MSNKFEQYEIKVKTEANKLTAWESIPVWHTTSGKYNVSLHVIGQKLQETFPTFWPNAIEIRINKVNSLQGYYFTIK